MVPQIRVHLKGYVRRGGTARHEERVREDVSTLVGPMMLILHREHDDQVQELEHCLLQALLHARRPSFLQEHCDHIEGFRLAGRQLPWFEDLERRPAGLVCDEGCRRRAAEGELVLGGRRNRVISFEVGQSVQGIRGRQIRFVCGEDHRLAALPQRPRES